MKKEKCYHETSLGFCPFKSENDVKSMFPRASRSFITASTKNDVQGKVARLEARIGTLREMKSDRSELKKANEANHQRKIQDSKPQ